MSLGEFYPDNSTEPILPNQLGGSVSIHNAGKGIRNRVLILLSTLTVGLTGWNTLPEEQIKSFSEEIKDYVSSIINLPGIEHITLHKN